MDLSNLGINDMILLYGQVIDELKQRKIIRSKNVEGDIGEYLAIDYYTKTPGLPKLQAAPPITKIINPISVNGERHTE